MEQASGAIPDAADLARRLAFLRNYADGTTIEVQLEQARRHAEATTAGIERFEAAPHDRDPARRLRVGLVSSDLRQHAVALFLLGVLRELDRDRIELFAYSGKDSGDPVNAAFKAVIRNWHGGCGRLSGLPRRQIAMKSASVTSCAVISAFIAQPTTRRENRSMTPAT